MNIALNSFILKAKSRLPDGQLALMEFNQLDALEEGMALFIFSAWSGVSLISFELLVDAIVGLKSNVKLIILDADAIEPVEFKRRFGEVPQGKGECYWIDVKKI